MKWLHICPKKLSLLALGLIMGSVGWAQESLLMCTDSGFCVTGVPGMPKTRGLSISYEFMSHFDITSKSQVPELGNSQTDISRNRRIEGRLKLPLVMKDRLKMGIGLNYFSEEFHFQDLGDPEYELYRNLDDKNLKSAGAALYVIRPLKGTNFFAGKVSVSWNGDYKGLRLRADRHYMRMAGSLVYGWKKNADTEFGFGLAYTYDLGRPSLIPLILYNHTFNGRWGVEAMLPGKLFVRHNFNKETIAYFGAKVNGASYHLTVDDTTVAGLDKLELRKSEVTFLLSIDRQIVDPVWISISAGYRWNVNFNLSENNVPRSDILIKSKLSNAFFLKLELYLVPPKKFYK